MSLPISEHLPTPEPFAWHHYFDVANWLVANPPGRLEEAFRRAAVSRAYYSVFCSTRNYSIKNLGYPKEVKSDVHSHLLEFLKPRRRFSTVWNCLKDLRRYRNYCDYNDVFPDDEPGYKEMSANSLELAKQALRMLQIR